MILPSRRWYLVAAGLAVLAPISLLVPEAGTTLFVADFLWVVAFLIDAWRIGDLGFARFPVRREAPPAFSVGRQLPVTYQWDNPTARRLTVLVREETPRLLETSAGRERRLELTPARPLLESVLYAPVRRGKATGGRLHLRVLGPWGLVWRQGNRELPWSVVVYP
ncbi:MAG TPA: hypothetical protein VGP87_10630, partial [Gemmatimonadales bacterium]|nr:hypothetical protein [Gemmatimonadales bacterium]